MVTRYPHPTKRTFFHARLPRGCRLHAMAESSPAPRGAGSCEDDRHADVQWAGAVVVACHAIQRGELLACGLEADVKSLDFAESAIGLRFGDPVGEVAGNLHQPGPLSGFHAEHWAAHTGLTEMI